MATTERRTCRQPDLLRQSIMFEVVFVCDLIMGPQASPRPDKAQAHLFSAGAFSASAAAVRAAGIG